MQEQFVLLSKDVPLIAFSSKKNRKYAVEDMQLFSDSSFLLPFEMRGRETPNYLESWLSKRISVIGRKALSAIEEAKRLDKDDILRFAKITHALSLNDVFWIKPVDSTLNWKNANLYHNDYSEELAQLGLSGSTKKTISLASRSPQYTVKGAMAKCWFRRQEKTLLCKIDSKPKSFLQSQACMEWVASKVADAFNIAHVKYTLEPKETGKGLRTASICEAFTSEDIGFVEASNFYRFRGMSEEMLRNEELFRDPAFQRRLAQNFCHQQMNDMMIFDFLIGNTDRHMGNYGMLYDTNTGEIIAPAPLFDNGLSFFAWDEAPKSVDEIEEWIQDNDTSTTYSDEGQLEEFLLQSHIEKIKNVKKMHFTEMKDFGFEHREVSFLERFLSLRAEQALAMANKLYHLKLL